MVYAHAGGLNFYLTNLRLLISRRNNVMYLVSLIFLRQIQITIFLLPHRRTFLFLSVNKWLNVLFYVKQRGHKPNCLRDYSLFVVMLQNLGHLR